MKSERALILLALLATFGCTVPPRKQTIQTDQAQAVVFFPNLANGGTQSEMDIQTAYDHLQNTRAALEGCLEGSAVEVQIISADDIVLQGAGTSSDIPLHGVTDANFGCLLVAPKREPQLIRATDGPRTLPVRCPAAAAAYFSVPRCCPEGVDCGVGRPVPGPP